jgi:beta-phosphoglucomutase-like phosphatase (HAD superfamily)
MVEAVLSDIDGTLVESTWLDAAAWRDAFAVICIPLGTETLRKQIGKGGDQLVSVYQYVGLRVALLKG